MVLPLPKGEGWGEGEGRFLMDGSSSVARVQPDLHVCAGLVRDCLRTTERAAQ